MSRAASAWNGLLSVALYQELQLLEGLSGAGAGQVACWQQQRQDGRNGKGGVTGRMVGWKGEEWEAETKRGQEGRCRRR